MIQFPYPGLRPFRQEESEIFFGREAQVDALLERLAGTRFLAIVGPSGCGKSSLVVAGMINALRTGFLSGAGARWRIAVMRPGTRPLYRLAEGLCEDGALGEERAGHPAAAAVLRATLSRGPLGLVEALEETPLPERTNLLVLVDQFEEIFRYGLDSDPDESTAFVDLLLTTAAHPQVPVYVVLTMRSDFLGDCTVFHGLPEAMNESQFLTPRLTREQQRAAIVGPAHLFEATVEPALVSHILNDMGPDPDQLPLMQHALLRVWVRASKLSTGTHYTLDLTPERIREMAEAEPDAPGPPLRGVHLELSHYRAEGGLHEALSRHADKVLRQLSESSKERPRIAEVLFRRLTARGARYRDNRRPTRLGEVAEVAGVAADEVIAVVEAFRRLGRSFVTPPAGVPLAPDSLLDISHESLIRQWGTLDRWVRSEARSAESYRYLEETARRWDENRRATEDGSSGSSDLWRGSNLDRALEWRAEERPTPEWASRYGGRFDLAMEFLEASERERRRQEAARRAELDRKRRAKEKKRLAAVKEDYTRRRLRAFRLWGTVATVLALLAGGFGVAAWIALKKVRLLEQERDLASRALNEMKSRPAVSLLLAAEAMERHPDDHPDHLSLGEQSLRKVLSTVFSATALAGHRGGVRAIRFVPGTSRLVTASDDRIYLWDLAAEPLGHRELASHSGTVSQLLVSADGRWLASIDVRKLLLWELSGETRALEPVEEILDAAFDPRGVRLAAAGSDGAVKIFGLSGDAAKLERTLRDGDAVNPVQAIAFSGDGMRLATASRDSEVLVWDLERQDVPPLRVGQQDVWYLEFDPSTARIAAASRADGLLSFWSVEPVAGARRLAELRPVTSSVQGVAFSPDGRWLVAWAEDGWAWLANLEAAPRVDAATRTFRLQHTGHVNSVAFSPDGAWLATSDSKDHVRLWDLGAEDPAARALRLPHPAAGALAFSPDGERLASGGPEGAALIWNLSQRPAAPVVLPVENEVTALGVSEDGRWLAASSGREVLLWSLPDLGPRPPTRRDPLEPVRLPHDDDVLALAFSPPRADRPARWLAAGGYDRKATLWELADPREPSRFIEHRDTVTQLAFDAGARRLAVGGWGGLVRVAKLEDPAAAALEHRFAGDVEALYFQEPGDRLVVVAAFGTAFDWPLDAGGEPAELAQSVTRIAASRGRDWLATLRHEQWIDLRQTERLASPAMSLQQDRVIALGLGSATGEPWRWLAAASDDRLVRVWAREDLGPHLKGTGGPGSEAGPDPRPRFELPHADRVRLLEFGPSARWLATAGRKELHLWDLQDPSAEQREPVSFQHPQNVLAVAFSPDGRWVVSAAADRRLRLWASERELLFDLACRTAGRNLTQEEWREFLPDESYRKTCQDLAAG